MQLETKSNELRCVQRGLKREQNERMNLVNVFLEGGSSHEEHRIGPHGLQ